MSCDTFRTAVFSVRSGTQPVELACKLTLFSCCEILADDTLADSFVNHLDSVLICSTRFRFVLSFESGIIFFDGGLERRLEHLVLQCFRLCNDNTLLG